MEKNSGIHVLYKNLGETPKECILRFKRDNPDFINTPMTYAGRLDPMAEGVLLVLSGDNLYKKDEFQDLPKTYEVTILWGFDTDTLDILGIVSGFSDKILSTDELSIFLRNDIGIFEQKYPIYSSKPVEGKPLFKWAREGRINEIIVPDHEVSIYDSKFLNREVVSKKNLLEQIEYKVGLVSGDFRQNDVISSWQKNILNINQEEFFIDKIRLEVSSGFYVRQYVKDLSERAGLRALTFHIKRVSVGSFKIN